jgi:hypothetical protein
MKLPNLKSCSLAVAASLGGVFLAPQAEAVNLSTDGVGEVAIAPYYTTRDGWQTLINLTNTTEHPLVVKVRIHEAWNSRDVFDITILMSKFDSFTALLTESGGVPVFRSVDTDTCTAPLGTTQAKAGDPLPQREWKLNNFAYGGGPQPSAAREWDGGPKDIDRLREGYVEFLAMGHYTNDGGPNDVVNLTADENGDTNPKNDSPGELIEAHDCSGLDTMFSSRANVLTAAQFAGEPLNALKFNYRLINVGRGMEAGGAATTWANFFNPGTNHIDGEVKSGDGTANDFGINPDPNVADSTGTLLACSISRGAERSTATAQPGTIEWNPDTTTAVDAASGQGSCMNLITAQNTFDFLEPSLNDAFPVVAHGWVDRYNNELELMNPMAAALIAEGREGLTGVFPQLAGGTLGGGTEVGRSVRGIDAVSLTIQRSAVINEWAFNTDASGGVATDWIVTFPTKTFYVDQDGRVNSTALHLTGFGQQAGLVAGDRDEAYYTNGTGAAPPVLNTNVVDVPYAPFSQPFITLGGPPAVVNTNNTGSCVGVQYNVYDRAQNTLAAGGGSIPSPAPPIPGADICYEANVLQFDGGVVLGSQVSNTVDTGNLGINGWLHLSFTDASANATGSGTIQAGTAGGLLGWSGLPVTGFVVKERTVGSVSGNYASSMDHGYRRMCDPSSTGWPAANAGNCPAVIAIDPD